MEHTVDFFFEFASPYSFIASVELRALSARIPLRILWRPIDLKSVWQRQGLLDAYAVIRRAKRAYIQADAHRVAESLGIPMRRSRSSVRADLARLVVYALDHESPGLGECFSENLFRRIWTEGHGLETWSDICSALPPHIDQSALCEDLSRAHVTQQLEQSHVEAAQLGCFGVPWFRAGDASFFGQDRLPLLERYLCKGYANPRET